MNFFWFFRGRKAASNQHLPAQTARFGNLSAIVWIVFAVLLTFGVWAYWAKLDQITRAPGAVIASSRTQIIQSQEGGTINDLLVKEGDTVEADQVLIKFERTRFETSYLEARAKAAGLMATVARLQAEVLGTKLEFPSELNKYPEFKKSQAMLFNKRQSAIKEDIASLQAMIKLVQQELEMTEPLLKSGDVSRTDILRLQRQLVEMKSQVTNKRNKYFQDAQAELGKAQEELAGVQQSLTQRKSQLDLTELRTPVRGVVKNVRITTLGGVIRPGEEVMQIVPLEDDLVIQAKVSPADIAFLKPGQDVAVKIDAYDYTVYGELSGKLTYISADTLSEDLRQGEQPYYRAQVRTVGRQFSGRPDEKLEIQPGMTATIEVKTGQRTVLQYLTKPVIKTLSQSLGER
ncbi:HlyD family type I secretion periplasmic adaptor subunit [Limnohabitans sp. yimb22184]|uniref:HlyD family type I secretion periplasmic adaptor subunit n=1 Tax=Limnohabitans sp. YIMB22184 TaxID=3374104 RepID=UPI003A853B6B